MRININMSEEMNKEFAKLGNEYAIPKSTIMTFILGQWLKEQKQVRINQEMFIDAQVDNMDRQKGYNFNNLKGVK